MKKINAIKNYPVYILDKNTATLHAKKIAKLVDTIPLVNYSEKEILASLKPGRIFHGKWEHSLIVFDKLEPIAVIIGYERDKENNNQYLENCIYISELAVDEKYRGQGIAKGLIKLFLEYNKNFLHLNGKLVYKIQTNAASWNRHVVDLYKSFGFKKTGEKEYSNRKDTILELG